MNAIITVSRSPYKLDFKATIVHMILQPIRITNAIRFLFPTSHIPVNSKMAAIQSMINTPFGNLSF